MKIGQRIRSVVGGGSGERAAAELADRLDRAAVAVAENRRLGRDLDRVVGRLEHDVYALVARHLDGSSDDRRSEPDQRGES